MKWIPLLALPLCLPLSSIAAEWVDLFDGKTTDGWEPRAKVETFEATDGELHLLSKTNVWVTTEIEMADFEVEMEVKLPDDAKAVGFNSGLAFRCIGAQGKPKGYQVEIDLKKPGGVYGIGLGGWLANEGADNFKADDWNHVRVVAKGPQIQTYVNGKLVSNLEDDRSLRGYFAIQHHGKGGTVKFRKIRAKDLGSPAEAAGRTTPNILWITAEDMSPVLGCYGDEYAITPHLDRFATESVRYTKAFAASPVCSPSRSCLISGMYPASMGTNEMRSAYPLPTGVRGFPSYLREAGHYCTNNVKTDYNTSDHDRLVEESWQESSATAHWRSAGRKDGQPFFAIFNDMTSHQSRSTVWPYAAFQKHVQSKLDPDEIHDPAKAPLPPYYPDTPVVRKEWARFYDCVTAMDKNVGRILAELEEDGLTEDTIVFFYSDHGSGMPRHKRLLHDSGMRVALMVRFPERFQHLAPAEPGAVIDRLVSFVDFAPTVLELTGQKVPGYMQGRNFFTGQENEAIYGSRDRVDEAFDKARSIRTDRYLYIRNYMPHLSYNQPTVFPDLGEIRRDITRYATENPEALTPAQRDYAGPSKPAEALYDCEADPLNLENLIESGLTAELEGVLAEMRKTYRERRAAHGDVGCLPESEIARLIREEGAPLGDIALGKTDHRPDLETAWAAADLVGIGEKSDFLELLKSPDASVRFWGVVGLRNLGDESAQEAVGEHLLDASAAVRIEAADWLAQGERYREEALAVLVSELENEDWPVAVRACRAIELLGERASSVKEEMAGLYARTRDVPGDATFFLAFSSGAFLDKLGLPTKPWDFTPGAGSFMPPKKK